MILPDVNVLLYAFRSDTEHHAPCREWLDGVVNGDEAYGMSPQVLCSFVRLATHPQVFTRPSRLEEALAFASTLLEQPTCTVVQPGSRHWSIFDGLSAQLRQGEPGAGCLVCGARDRVRLRVGDHGPRLRCVPRLAVAPSG